MIQVSQPWKLGPTALPQRQENHIPKTLEADKVWNNLGLWVDRVRQESSYSESRNHSPTTWKGLITILLLACLQILVSKFWAWPSFLFCAYSFFVFQMSPAKSRRIQKSNVYQQSQDVLGHWTKSSIYIYRSIYIYIYHVYIIYIIYVHIIQWIDASHFPSTF